MEEVEEDAIAMAGSRGKSSLKVLSADQTVFLLVFASETSEYMQ